MSAIIRVRFSVHGTHCWPDAPPRRAYLRNPHRHLFHVTVQMAVSHDEREIEFHDLMDAARGRFTCGVNDSCETMARALATELVQLYQRPFLVIVSEDGECEAEAFVAYDQKNGPKNEGPSEQAGPTGWST